MKIRTFLFLILGLAGACNMNTEPWTFTYSEDPFSGEALMDLRYLNEEEAGMHGFVRLSEDGESFVRGDGKPVRFWSANVSGIKDHTPEEAAYLARFLAKMGVNMVRFHTSINPAGKGTMINWVDTSEVDAIWKMVAAMKKEGIYSTISPFWAHNGHMGGWVPEEWGIEGYSGKDALWGVMYFSDTLKEAYKSWVKYLYTENNPYNGIPLKDEPAVGLIQVKNEDGLFFWTFQSIKPELESEVSRQFTQWLIEKYGSYAKASEAWNGFSLPKDVKNDKFGLFITWELTNPAEGDAQLRMTDQMEFLTEVQYDFYKEIHDYYRNDLGCSQLINANNWKTADPCRLFDAERLTYTACEVSAVNRYFAPGHHGEFSGWRIQSGDHYQGVSALKNPVSIPVNIKQTKGMPMIVTESGWNLPHKYQSEAPLLIASYMSLTGVDSYYWFNINTAGLMEDPYFRFIELEDGTHPLNRWTYSTPGGVFMFPANALMFRMNYIAEGKTMLRENRSPMDIYERKIPVLCEENSYDPNRDADFNNNGGSGEQEVNPLIFLTGKVVSDYQSKNYSWTVDNDFKNLVNTEEKTVVSSTGQMSLNYGKGIFTLDTPYAKGISGFLGGDVGYILDGLSVKSIDDYATLSIVPLDDKLLLESEKILIQAGTVYRPEGWKEEPAQFETNNDTLQGYRILSTGNMPWKAERLKMRIELRNLNVTEAVKLDNAGYPVETLDLKRKDGDVVILDLPEDCIYVVLK